MTKLEMAIDILSYSRTWRLNYHKNFTRSTLLKEKKEVLEEMLKDIHYAIGDTFAYNKDVSVW